MAVTTSAIQTGTASQATAERGFQGLKTEDFFKLLITELSNQSPLDPIDNNQLLDQISAINTVQSTATLIDTLEALSLSQNLGSASNLIGKTVSGRSNDEVISGVVDKAVVEDGEVFLMIDDQKLPIASVTEVG